jgi:phosphoglucomutase
MKVVELVPVSIHPLAGKPAPRDILEDIPKLISRYYALTPDVNDVAQQVAFGTSGHRGSSFDGRFNEAHILATTQAICDFRKKAGYTGPLYLGKDTHALSEPAWITALEVLAANDVTVRIDSRDGFTPTPVLSHAIVRFNSGRDAGLADGIVITPSHNPPRDGGFKYNPPHGGPAGSDLTGPIQARANKIMRGGLSEVRRTPLVQALTKSTTERFDYVTPYVDGLGKVVDMEAIKSASLSIGADPMGGAGVHFWAPIVEKYGLDIDLVSDVVDPTFSFMHVDKDGKIRMDCSSKFAMSGLIALKDKYDIAFGNDTDYDRHGIVTKSSGLLNPNHYLAVAIQYLFENRPGWGEVGIGKTVVSSSMINRVAAGIGRKVVEVPVGFKWFVDGLSSGSLGFGGEESAGASYLQQDGSTWTTDKDGIILDLLAAEITAKTGRDPGEHYKSLEEKYGSPIYERLQSPATRDEKAKLASLSAEQVTAQELAGEPILAKLTAAPSNGASLGGLKVETENGWFAARPSGTEDVYKIYAESFLGQDHLARIQEEARTIVTSALG